MKNKRIIVQNAVRMLHRVFRLFGRRKRKHILFDAPYYFHFLHIQPLILAIKDNPDIQITIIKWQDFDTAYQIPGIRFLSQDDLNTRLYDVYDCYLATDHYRMPWWFDSNVLKIYMSHGVGPKGSYIKTKKLHDYDYIFSPGAATAQMQAEIISSEKIIETGLPITDQLTTGQPLENSLFDFKDPSRATLLYAPSWSNSPEMISMDEDLLAALKNQTSYNVLIKPHPLLLKTERCGGKNWRAILDSLTGDNVVVFLNAETSIYNILQASDILIGDISSVIYEFMVLNRPIIITADEAMFQYYGVEEAYNELLASVHKITKAEDLSPLLIKIASGDDAMFDARKHLLAKTLAHPGNATNTSKQALLQLLHIQG